MKTYLRGLRLRGLLIISVFVLSIAGAGAAHAASAPSGRASALLPANEPAQARQAKGASGVHFARRATDLRGGAVRYVAGPATAADCPDNYLCLYDAPHYSGNMLQVTGSGVSYNLANYGFANLTSSWISARSRNSYLHDPPSLDPPEICVAPGSSSPSAGTWSNRIDVVYLAATAELC